MMTPDLAILADDLTGATDTGLQFAKHGRRTCVSLTWPVSAACDVLVVDLDSRARNALDAAERAAAATRSIRSDGPRQLYKKIDSTGRGNIGAEIEGTLREYPCDGALVCPAFPQLGRTVRDGLLYVGGVKLDCTEFARDPIWPATTASLEAIVRRQSNLPTASIGLEDIRRGPADFGGWLRELLRRGNRMILADAETDEDLRFIAKTLEQSESRILPVGSAGLAEWLADSLGRPQRTARNLSLGAGPLLVVAGTMNRVGMAQLARLVDGGAAVAALDLERALADPLGTGEAFAPDVIRHLWTARCVVVSLVDPREPAPDLRLAMESRRLTPGPVTERLIAALARAATRAMDAVAPAALVLTGGDTARAVCGALGIQALEILSEAAPGVPISRLQGGRWDGLPVVTKAGGFGQPETLARVTQVLEAMRT
jgi:uncharacterized protein YgbK (DUF1537 family)